MAALGFREIRKSYGDTVALRGVSFDVEAGEVFGLLGPNGAGKTTLIRILMDIIRADDGTMTLFGEPHRRAALDRVGYLPEERGLYAKRSVLDVLTYFGTLKGLPRREASARGRSWLERLDLSETAAWRIERLSKGMSQKVQIAATLLPEPDLVVLDEPFSGLDPVNARTVQELIRERRASGRTTILSTHGMSQVEALCDRVALIHRGALMVYGPVGEVRERYSSPEVRVTVGGELPELAGASEAVREGDATWRIRLTDGRSPADYLAELVHRGAAVERYERVLAPIEDIFIRVVGEGAP